MTDSRPLYLVHVERDGDWWGIEVPEVDGAFSQARRLDQVEAMAREVVALLLDVSQDSFDLELDVNLPEDWAHSAAQVAELRASAEQAEQALSHGLRNVAARLVGAGLPVRDVGRILGVSAQRVSQLTASR